MPAGGAADGKAALLESLESDTEARVVDAQALAECGPGERLVGAAESGAVGLGQRARLCGAAGGGRERERRGARR